MTAAAGARALTDETGRFAVVLPGSWVSIPLADTESIRSAVGRIVRARVPRDDKLAAVRREIREELFVSARQASVAGATLYALSMELIPGLPFPASMIGYRESWPVVTPGSVDLGDSLIAAVPNSVALTSSSAPLVRRSALRSRLVGETTMYVLDLEYWFAEPEGGGLLCLMVSVPNCPSEALVTELFDAIAGSVFWSQTTSDDEAGRLFVKDEQPGGRA